LLLSKIDEFCKGKSIDFLLLFADNKKLYVNAGFKSVHNNGIGHEKMNELMIKEIGNIKWEDGKIDLLGYLY